MSEKMPSLPERITTDNAESVVRAICQSVQAAEGSLVDLSSVAYCDSAGVAALLEAKVQSEKQLGTLTYQSPPLQLRALATFLKVESLLFSP